MAIIVGTFDTKGTRTKYLILSLLSPRFARSTNSKDSKLTPMTMRICENPRTTPAASSSRRAPSPSPHEEPPPTYPFSTAIDNEPKPIKSRLIAGYLLVRGRAKQSQDVLDTPRGTASDPTVANPKQGLLCNILAIGPARKRVKLPTTPPKSMLRCPLKSQLDTDQNEMTRSKSNNPTIPIPAD